MNRVFNPNHLKVFFSNKYVYAKVLQRTRPNEGGHYIVSASTIESDIRTGLEAANQPTSDIHACSLVGKLLAERAKENKIETVHFERKSKGQADRTPSRHPVKYHGKLKALIDSIQGNGLKVH